MTVSELEKWVKEDGKCVHTCRSGKHILSVHSIDDSEECNRVEEQLWKWPNACRECAWSDTSISAVRGYIR